MTSSPALHFWFASETGTAEAMAWDAYYRVLETVYGQELKRESQGHSAPSTSSPRWRYMPPRRL